MPLLTCGTRLPPGLVTRGLRVTQAERMDQAPLRPHRTRGAMVPRNAYWTQTPKGAGGSSHGGRASEQAPSANVRHA
jgi:hypothetical protein